MTVLADYEGVGVAFGLVVWLIVTTLAWVMGLAGIWAGARRRPKPALALALGGVAGSLEIASISYLWWSFCDEWAHYGAATAEHDRPDRLVWIIAAATIIWVSVSVFLGIARRRWNYLPEP